MKAKLPALLLGVFLIASSALAQEVQQPPNIDIGQLAKTAMGEGGTTEEKTRRLVNWVNTNFKWSATDYQKRTVEEIIARRAGNCFELANVLAAFFDSVGIRYRWVAEINIQAPSERRRRSAEQKVSESGNKMSVFGYMHNDHRWLEVYDENSRTWFPADPAIGVVGVNEWISARMAFNHRRQAQVPAVAEIVEQMVVPFAVVALDSKRGKPVENRSAFYVVEGFNNFYGKQLHKLPSWNEWKTVDARLAPIVATTFAGETNLHEQEKLIEEIAQAYEKLKAEANQRGILPSSSSIVDPRVRRVGGDGLDPVVP